MSDKRIVSGTFKGPWLLMKRNIPGEPGVGDLWMRTSYSRIIQADEHVVEYLAGTFQQSRSSLQTFLRRLPDTEEATP